MEEVMKTVAQAFLQKEQRAYKAQILVFCNFSLNLFQFLSWFSCYFDLCINCV